MSLVVAAGQRASKWRRERGKRTWEQVQRPSVMRADEEGFTLPVPLARCVTGGLSADRLSDTDRKGIDTDCRTLLHLSRRARASRRDGGEVREGLSVFSDPLEYGDQHAMRDQPSPDKDFAERSDRLSVLVLLRVGHLGASECQVEFERRRGGGGCTWRFM